MNGPFNPYAVLGIEQTADAAQIKAAFRRRAKETHPDKGGDPAEFANVNRAHDILTDDAARRLFDETGALPDDAPDSADAKAATLISTIIGNALFGDEEPTAHDCAEMIRRTIGKLRTEHDKRLVLTERARGRARKMRERFRRKGKADTAMAAMLDWHIRQAEAAVAATKDNIDTCDRALKMVEGLSFDWDRPLPSNTFFVSDSGAPTTTGGQFGPFLAY